MRYIVSRLALVLLGIMLFIGMELSLRVAWEPPSTPDQQLLLTSIDPFERDDDHFVTRESYRAALRVSRFPSTKTTGTFRVFCLGGSATFGYPYPANDSWPAVLQRALQTFAPDQTIEVINLGGTSYGTSRVLGLLRGVVKYDPDLVIVYSGNNEFVEDSYRVQIQEQSKSKSFVNQLYLSQALRQLLPAGKGSILPETVTVEEVDSRAFFFSPTVDGDVYQPTVIQSQEVLERYRDNLVAMADLAKRHNVPLVFATIASNLGSWPPDTHGSIPEEPGQNIRWQQLLAEARQAKKAGRTTEAITEYRAAIALFDGNASVNFALASLLLKEGDHNTAIDYLTRARDLDPTPVRATSAMNTIVRETAAQHDILLVDIAEMAREVSPDRIPGDLLFVDNVHPTPKGNITIARAMANSLWKTSTVPPPQEAKADGFWNEEFIRSDTPPALDVNIAYTWGQVYLRKGVLDKAEELLRSAIAQGYQHPSAPLFLAETLARKGETQQAFQTVYEIYKKHPEYSETYPLLAHLSRQVGQNDLAITAYTSLIESKRPAPDHFAALSLILLQERRPAEAEKVLQQGLSDFPGNCHLSATYGRVLEQQSQPDRAEVSYRETLRSDPGCQAGWENLGLLQMNQRRFEDAAATFRSALSQPGALPSHHLNLGLAYHFSGDEPDKTSSQFRIVAEQAPELIRYIPTPYREEILAEMRASE